MKLWESIRENWNRHVAGWNARGLPWREWSVREILWIEHTERVQRLVESKSKNLRPYLIEMGDEETLRAWDVSSMKQSAESTPAPSPARRRR